MSAESDMLKARAQLLMDQPFFGTLAMRLKMILTEDTKTAATDGKRLIYNPEYIKKLSSLTRKGLIAHEVMHCVFNHMTRRGARDPKRWNIACDFAINLHLIDCGFVLPEGALVDEKYRDMNAEAIYNALDDDNMPKQCAWGMVMDAGAGQVQSGSNAAMESEWQVAVTQAAEVAKQAGKMPGELQNFIQDIVKPLVDWRSVLWPFVASFSNDDYSWRKPNRAYISEDEYLPSMFSESAGKLAVLLDSSGSCSEYWTQFMGEMAAIHSDLRPDSIIIVHCDADVQHTEEITEFDSFPTENNIHGGGGTRFAPAFDYLNEHHPDVEAAVYLTDLECYESDFGDEPPYPVLWINTERTEAPWGQTVHIPLEAA
jgi:predicted metal-dependent peptidase